MTAALTRGTGIATYEFVRLFLVTARGNTM